MKDVNLKELEEIIEQEKMVFATFKTEWCGDCKMMDPFLLKLEEKFQASVKFVRLDAEKENVFRSEDSKYKVLKVPTMILFKDKEEVSRGYEFIPMKTLEGWINSASK